MSLPLRLFSLLALFFASLFLSLRCYRMLIAPHEPGTIGGETPPRVIRLIDLNSGARWEWHQEAHRLGWQMRYPVSWPANPFFVDQLLSGLASVKNLELKGEPLPLEKSHEGKMELSFLSAEREDSFVLSGTAVWSKGQKRDLPLPEDWKAVLNPLWQEMLMTRLWDWELAAVDGMILEFPKKEERHVFSRREGIWSAENFPALSSEKLDTLLASILRLEVEQFLPEQEENVLTLGLQVPDCRLTLFCRYESHVLEIGKSFYKKSQLRFAKRPPCGAIFSLPCDFLQGLSDPHGYFGEDFPQNAS
ncbi:MAG: hypothetical protein LBT57_00305 [Puniceicoccales bacterium]|jgi:hypothetical protein|nr:hypothetical protein [Puniceicoccales bacterium]